MDSLAAGEKFDLAIAARDALLKKIEGADRTSLLKAFGIHDDPEWSWTDTLLNAGAERLVALAVYLGVPVPGVRDEVRAQDDVGPVDAYAELVAAETALRDVIRLAVPAWTADLGDDDLQKLRDKRAEEDKKRDGIAVSQDLLDYTEVYQIQKIIEKNWLVVKPVLDDKKRTEVYLGIIFDIRNTIGHSRPVVPAERLLLAGAAGQIRNQLARYRSSLDGSASHYSSIDSARDSLGQDGLTHLANARVGLASSVRIEVGDVIEFELAATDPRGRVLEWTLFSSSTPSFGLMARMTERGRKTGTRATMTWTVDTTDVGEQTEVVIRLRNASQYQRNEGYDDARAFYFKVNPPVD